MEHFYFHNCLYERVWKENRRRYQETTPTWDVLHTFPHDYKAVFVGDASMSPYEIAAPGGSVEHFNEEAGAVWMERLVRTYPACVWLNPVPEASESHGIDLHDATAQGNRMYRLADGLTRRCGSWCGSASAREPTRASVFSWQPTAESPAIMDKITPPAPTISPLRVCHLVSSTDGTAPPGDRVLTCRAVLRGRYLREDGRYLCVRLPRRLPPGCARSLALKLGVEHLDFRLVGLTNGFGLAEQLDAPSSDRICS
jgi:hypothetical protein